MKLGWSLAAIGTSLALGLSAARAGEPSWLAPVVRVEGDGRQPLSAAPAAPAVAMPTGQGGGQDCNGGCNQAAIRAAAAAKSSTPPMIGNDLPANTYNGQFLRNTPSLTLWSRKCSAVRSRFPTMNRLARKIACSCTTPISIASTFPGVELVPAPAGSRRFVGRPAFNTDVHRETFGFEKTFLGGDASIGVRMNVIQRDGDVQDDDFGDTTIIGKYTLINRENLLVSVGLAVTAPTGTANSGGFGTTVSLRVVPAVQRLHLESRAVVRSGLQCHSLFSTNDNDPKFATYDLGAGYRLYQSECCKDRWLTYVIPTVEAHANLPTTKEGFANRDDIRFAGFVDHDGRRAHRPRLQCESGHRRRRAALRSEVVRCQRHGSVELEVLNRSGLRSGHGGKPPCPFCVCGSRAKPGTARIVALHSLRRLT